MKTATESGYTYCGCRDCLETVVSDDMANPDLCDDCAAAGCSLGNEDGGECCNPEAYGSN